jgi:TolB-like protein
MVAPVSTDDAPPGVPVAPQRAANDALASLQNASVRTHRAAWWAIAVVLVAGAALTAYSYTHRHQTQAAAAPIPNPKSIAVLPFLDMTDTMTEEPFADGMTDELIDKLSQSQGLHVSSPTSSFYFKDKQVTVAQVGKALNVAYVLDGSVRKSGNTLRVSARLVRTDDGFVVWSQTYDRSWADKLMIQDDIASEVTKALKSSIN